MSHGATRYPGLTPPPPSGQRNRSGRQSATGSSSCQAEATLPPGEGYEKTEKHQPGTIEDVTQPAQKPSKENLDFGWFSMPRNGDGSTSREGGPNGDVEHERVISRSGSRNEYKCGSRLETRTGSRTGSRAAYANIEHGCGPMGQPCPPIPSIHTDEKVLDQNTAPWSQNNENIIDWPLSYTAQQQIRARQQMSHPTTERHPSGSRSASRANMTQTPMPPLLWDGYKECSARPTYATWREQCRQEQNEQTSHELKAPYFRNSNNNHYPSLEAVNEFDSDSEHDLNDSSIIEYINTDFFSMESNGNNIIGKTEINKADGDSNAISACGKLSSFDNQRCSAPRFLTTGTGMYCNECSITVNQKGINKTLKKKWSSTPWNVQSRIKQTFTSLNHWPRVLIDWYKQRPISKFSRFHNEELKDYEN